MMTVDNPKLVVNVRCHTGYRGKETSLRFYIGDSRAHRPYELSEKVSARIMSQVKGISPVACDISSKPPATIEWE